MTEKEQQRLSRVVWFEIPTVDLARATAFYEDILNLKMLPYQGVGAKMNIFPYTQPAIRIRILIRYDSIRGASGWTD